MCIELHPSPTKVSLITFVRLSLHIITSLLVIPVYTPLRWKTKLNTKNIKTRSEGALSQLQDCFTQTVWYVFEQQNLEEYTETVLFYIKDCADNVTVNKQIWEFSNQKPWITSEVQTLLKNHNTTFRSGDRALYSTARANLRRGIKEAKEAY